MKNKSLVLISLMCALTLALSGCIKLTVPTPSTPDNGQGTEEELGSTDDDFDEESTDTTSSFKNNVLTTSKMKVQILDYKIIPVGNAGNEYGDKPIIAFLYKTTNLTNDELTPNDAFYEFHAYQDNNPNVYNELDMGMYSGDEYVDTENEVIKKGGTVENIAAFDLDDLVTPVKLVVRSDSDNSIIGSADFKVK